ncbi:MAG: NAD(P)H-binding protein [Gammaproteobacteria bacterium]|nr:NAD(P)H-binding protein [Gammaproteobacteria bacterium]
MTILITGASGQYGRSATDKLIAAGHARELVLLTRKPDKLADRTATGCQVRYGDFDHPASLAAAMQGIDTMLLISGTRVGKRVAQHKAAIDAAAAAGVRHIIYTSVVGISPDNPAIVVRDHGPTEELIKASGCAWTMLRDQHYADAMIVNMGPNLIRSGQWLTSTAGGREALVWREDCVDCAVAVLTGSGHQGKTYNITGPELLNFADVARMLTEVTGHEVKLIETTDAGMYAMFDAMGIPREPVDDQVVAGIPWNSNDMVTFEASIRGGHFAVLSNDVEHLTGRKPRSVRQLIELHAAMLQAAKSA